MRNINEVVSTGSQNFAVKISCDRLTAIDNDMNKMRNIVERTDATVNEIRDAFREIYQNVHARIEKQLEMEHFRGRLEEIQSINTKLLERLKENARARNLFD